jgi:hypothetical protein
MTDNIQYLSKKAINALIKLFPDWVKYITGKLEGIRIDVPALENPNMSKGLFICSDGAGIEVNMDDDHERFFPWEYDSDELLIQSMSEFVKEVVEERIISALYKNGDKRIGSCWLKPEEDARSAWEHGNPTFVRLKSWRGTYDQEINL